MWRAALEGASLGVIAADPAGTIYWVNSTADRLFGYTSGELAGRPLASLIPEQYRTRHEAHVLGYFRAPRPRPAGVGMELKALRKDGSEFPVEISLGFVDPPDGPLAVAFVTDITDRKLLQAERDRFFDMSVDPLCIVRLDGSFSQVSPAWALRLGYAPEEMLGRRFGTFTHPDDLAKSRAALQRLLAGEDMIHFESRLISKDGTVRWFQWNATAPSAGDIAFYAAARDITDAKAAAETQQRLAALIENISDFVALAAVEDPRQILHVNDAGRKMLGLPALAQLREMRATDIGIIDPDTQTQIANELATRGNWTGEANLYHFQTHEPIPVELSIFMVMFNGGTKPIARAAVARDIRERKRHEARLHALTGQLLTAQEEERRRIARDLHDDMTQRLAGLAIELGLMRREPLATQIALSVSRMQGEVTRLTEDMRGLARELHPGILEHAGLGPALEAYCAEVSRTREIRIRYSVKGVTDDISSDVGVVLYRIAQEGMGNAVKHSGASLVQVALEWIRDGGARRVRLTVSDNGKGFVVEKTREGSGLGLLSIEERTQLVHGELRIHSIPGTGTRVEVEIPLQ